MTPILNILHTRVDEWFSSLGLPTISVVRARLVKSENLHGNSRPTQNYQRIAIKHSQTEEPQELKLLCIHNPEPHYFGYSIIVETITGIDDCPT